MCKCCQSCLETIWWHLIEKRFCYDESIALYEVTEEHEKNNNIFENIAFYDSVSKLAGRAVVTISPKIKVEPSPIEQQPKMICDKPDFEKVEDEIMPRKMFTSAPDIRRAELSVEDIIHEVEEPTQSMEDLSVGADYTLSATSLKIKSMTELREQEMVACALPRVELRKKSLMARRMSRSLNVRLDCIGDQCREVPIIRQNSVPKFFLGTPEEHQIETSINRVPSTVLTSPVPVTNKHGFIYDLSSVVQLEKEKAELNKSLPQVPDTNKKQFRDKIIKLRRIKSTMTAFQTHHM